MVAVGQFNDCAVIRQGLIDLVDRQVEIKKQCSVAVVAHHALPAQLAIAVQAHQHAVDFGFLGCADVIGFAGDFARNAIWGTVEGISVAMSDQVTVNKAGTQINTWQRNMFAIRAEVEVGFIVRDADHFVKLTGATTAP